MTLRSQPNPFELPMIQAVSLAFSPTERSSVEIWFSTVDQAIEFLNTHAVIDIGGGRELEVTGAYLRAEFQRPMGDPNRTSLRLSDVVKADVEGLVSGPPFGFPAR